MYIVPPINSFSLAERNLLGRKLSPRHVSLFETLGSCALSESPQPYVVLLKPFDLLKAYYCRINVILNLFE